MMKEMPQPVRRHGEDDDLIIVSGAQQGIDLVCKCLLQRRGDHHCGKPQLCRSTQYPRPYNANLGGRAMDQDGINIEKLEEALKANSNTKLMYLIPNLQNPSGIT